MGRKICRWLWGVSLGAGLALAPHPVLAIQTHGHPEGLYAHQLGHLAFLGGMIYLCWQIWRRRLLSRAGFRWLFLAGSLFAGWNLLTFFGHWAEERLDPGAIDASAGHLWRQLHIIDFNGLLFYLAKLDHLILIPALVALYLALRAFLAEQREMAA